ncbi:zinc ribbon domain-containing protein [Polaromonas sp. OV174]|uniref:zinc ribbon domain-containing protein n=1 Tax=Polaromonas sp. OV174 TaxID=1855300 RepID=UPI000B82437F|nr:zinc ribbon domain-containing protein [Polaromonas sp. OV174]
MKSLQPTLYQLAEDGRTLDFFFVQCPACGGLSFPANVPGCTHCGDALVDAQKVSRPGGGELLEYVTLHVPLVPGVVAPRIAGDIRIADGVVEEGMIAAEDGAALSPGVMLQAVAEMRDAEGVYACRFVPANAKVAS